MLAKFQLCELQGVTEDEWKQGEPGVAFKQLMGDFYQSHERMFEELHHILMFRSNINTQKCIQASRVLSDSIFLLLSIKVSHLDCLG